MVSTITASCCLQSDTVHSYCLGSGSRIPLTSPFINNKVRIHVDGVWRGRVFSNYGSPCAIRAVLADPPFHQPQQQTGRAGRPSSADAKLEMGMTDTSPESTLEHILWLGFGFSAVVGMVVKAVGAAHTVPDFAGMGLGAMAGYVLADLGTGIYHWGVDNYGDSKTPVFGSQIDGFQGHHKRPWTITKREFANNIHALARPAGFALLPFLGLPSNPTADTFLGVFLGLVVMSQQFHAWAHTKKSQVPPIVNSLQENGILVSRKMHGVHHKAPFSVNYCIVSGLWNPILSQSQFFLRLEVAIHSKWGIAPRNWAEIGSEWLQDGSYFEDGTDMKLDQDS